MSTAHMLTNLIRPASGPTPIAPPGMQEKADTIIGVVMWGGLMLCLVGVIVGGATLWIDSQRGGVPNVGKILMGAIGAVVIGGASGLIAMVSG